MIEFDGNIMLFGSPLTGKTILARNILLNELKKGYSGIYITTNDIGEDVANWFDEYNAKIRIIDCISKTIQPNSTDTEAIKRVTSPIDLTGVSVQLNKFLETNYKSGIKSIVIFDSISSFLMYTNLQTVYRFMHVITRRIKVTKSKAIYIVHDGVHDDKTIATLKQMFDGVIEVKEEDNRKFFRFVSSTHKTDWKEFSIKGKEVVIV